MYNRIDEYFIKYYNTSPTHNIINNYLYFNTVLVNYLYIGAIIGKKGANIKALITDVKHLTSEGNFEYYIDKTITDKKYICIYILANNTQTLSIATKQLHSNIHKYM